MKIHSPLMRLLTDQCKKGSRIYTFARDIEPGTYEFKVASEDWSTVNFGALSSDDSDRNVVVGQSVGLAATNDNLILTIENADRYVFVFNVHRTIFEGH